MAVSKVFIVTGASKGIGAAVADYLLKQSHKVVLTARSEDLLESIKKSYPGQVEYVAGDITKAEVSGKLTDLAVKSFGKVDGVVISHGALDTARIKDSSVDAFKSLYDVNVFSGLAVATAALDELRKSKGSIIWVSSGAASTAYVAWGAYGSSKAAVNAISAHVATEEPDITSIAIGPGRVDTEMQGVIRSSGKESMDKAQYDSFVDAFNQGILLKPSQPGSVIARFLINPQKDLSGKFISWNAPVLEAYQE